MSHRLELPVGGLHQAVDNFDAMTQYNAVLVEESSAAARSLRDRAQRLSETVQAFKVAA
jgi:methyl-accepting chemotaxis protein